ncbi:MAG: class I SAM-dependent methyltransferase [Planctomycetes bacterium]|nr:class I SAM-dependent methyltransferase [Planctomycetota bacterium]
MTDDALAPAYPLFRRPDAYHEKRCASALRNRIQRWSERRTLRALLGSAEGIHSVCDIPCGIGRSFELWAAAGLSVLGVELSPPMAERAERERASLGLPGRVEIGDAFAAREGAGRADLVVCLRFAYYFSPAQRRGLLAALRERSRRYLLIQYRVGNGILGRWKSARAEVRMQRRATRAKHACPWEEIRPELESAGWRVLRMRRQSPLSDRVLILAERSAWKG